MDRLLRPALAAAFGSMGVLHLVPPATRRMAEIVPRPLARRPGAAEALVVVTGFCELAGAVGLMIPATRRATGAALIAFLAAVFPANVRAARHPERFGPLAVPVLPRLALQVLFAGLVLRAARA